MKQTKQPEIPQKITQKPRRPALKRLLSIALDPEVFAAVEARDANRSREINSVLKQHYNIGG